MRTTLGTTSSARSRRRSVTSALAVLGLALPLTGVIGGLGAVASASDGGTAALQSADVHGKSATAGSNGRSGPGTPGFIGPVAPTAGPTAAPTPFVNQGGVTTGANTTKYETVADGKGSTFTGVGGGQPSGDISSPQPYSTADQNNTGANDTSASNPYRSTRDGSPSLNGNGGGQQVGQPCAGCVGKADNKNPPGQAPNATDGNAGYECDRNHGIGRSNPAHTGCTAGVTQTPSPSPTPSVSPTTCPNSTTPMPPGGVKDCSPGAALCPNGSPMPPGGVAQCSTQPPGVTCPAGSTMTNGVCTVPPQPGVTCPAGSTMTNGWCTVPPQPGVSCPAGSTMTNGVCTVPPQPGVSCPEGTTMVNGACSAPVATVCPAGTMPQVDGSCLSPTSGGTTGGAAAPGTAITTPLNRPVVGQGSAPTVIEPGTANSARALPFTGSNAGRVLGLGGLLLLLGAGLVLAGRVKRAG